MRDTTTGLRRVLFAGGLAGCGFIGAASVHVAELAASSEPVTAYVAPVGTALIGLSLVAIAMHEALSRVQRWLA